MDNNEALRKEDLLLDLYKIHAYIPNDAQGNSLTPFGNFSAGYEAAQQQSACEIVKLKARHDRDSEEYNAMRMVNIELQNHINVLREALCQSAKIISISDDDYELRKNTLNKINEALSATSTQSLQAHDGANHE